MCRFTWQTALATGIFISGIVLGWTTLAAAQVRPIADDTLGSERSRVVPLDPQVPIDRIEGGARRGDNLFHSFREFHVDQGRGVYFADPGVDNILTRVTGGVESQILGVLGVLGDANLFLINPSGIIFGPNARLEVRGSFVATTADALQLGDQGWFSATDPAAPPLLTVQPTAFLFNQLNPAAIANNSTASETANPSGLPGYGLRVPEGEGLTLLGGNISMDGGGLNALGGRVEVGGLSEPGIVTLNADGSLGFPTGVVRSDVLLSNQAFIDVAADGGGSITVNANNFEILRSSLSAGIGRNSGSVGAQAGDITLNASDIRGVALIRNLVGESGVGNGGDIRITTDSLSFTNDTELRTGTFGRGNAGSVIIQARDRVALDDAGVFSNVGNGNSNIIPVGNGGDIRIMAGSLSLTNGAELQAITYGQGDAGNVIINARDRFLLDGTNLTDPDSPSAILSTVGDGDSNVIPVGNGGDIRISTSFLSLTNRAQLIAGIAGQGDAGNIIINARDRFSLTNGASLTTTTFGQGDAGNIIINARDRVVLDNAPIFSTVGSYLEDIVAVGDGGDIRITTGSLSLINGAQLQAITFRQGNAGNVIIRTRDRVFVEGVNQQGFLSGIFTSTQVTAQGRGGDVNIDTNSIHLVDGAIVSAETLNGFSGGSVTLNANTFEATGGGRVVTATSGSGQAGNITLNVTARITLSGINPNYDDLNFGAIIGQGAAGGGAFSDQGAAGGLYASTTPNASGRGGTIQITTGQLQVFDQARVVVDSQGSSIAGNLDIAAFRVQLNDQARLTAETVATNGGNITLRDLDLLLLDNNSLISTTAGTHRTGGDGGNINIDADFIVAISNENSDIRANAFSGSGGNVRITTEGLFGIAAQLQDNPLTNDITASSQFGVQGTVEITPPDVDPRRGLLELPPEVVDASNQIAQTCSGGGAGESVGEFIVTGRGGVPAAPTDSLIGEESLMNWSTLDESEAVVAPQFPEGVIAPSRQEASQEADIAAAIVEAQEWTVAEDGTVKLIAAVPDSTVQTPATCRSQEN
ncbi:S-layer family protein [Cyanobacteria bacterium FACHB-471]|nr:S-layer family protein [Cyanobacteria bacterium FACHB-471]